LPEDGQVARRAFLALLEQLTEVWICAYGFTLQPMFDELKQADAKGATLHILLDHSEAETRAEAGKVRDLVSNLRHGDLTITTTSANSQRPGYIWHWKGMVVKPADGQAFQSWEGSTNFTESAWFEGNSARSFRSDLWAQTFIHQFEVHRAWALANEPQYQVTPEQLLWPAFPDKPIPVQISGSSLPTIAASNRMCEGKRGAPGILLTSPPDCRRRLPGVWQFSQSPLARQGTRARSCRRQWS
jgi:PLD-like domain